MIPVEIQYVATKNENKINIMPKITASMHEKWEKCLFFLIAVIYPHPGRNSSSLTTSAPESIEKLISTTTASGIGYPK